MLGDANDLLKSLYPLPGAHTCDPAPPNPLVDEFFVEVSAHRCSDMRQRFEDGEIRCLQCATTTGVMS